MAKGSEHKLTTFQTVAPFAIAAICLPVAAMLWYLPSHSSDAGHVWFGIVGTVLVFDLPVCFLILIGHPPVMTLSPLLPSAEEKALRRDLRTRPELSDDEFYMTFYAETDVPRDVPMRVRREIELALGWDLTSIHPRDNVVIAYSDLDFADALIQMEEAFNITSQRGDWDEIDGTFDSFVQYISQRMTRS